MVPDTCLRLRTVLKALDDIVTPALPSDAGFAHEQLGMIKKSLQLAIDQIPHEYAFMVQDARDHLALAGQLSPYIAPGSALQLRLGESFRELEATLPAFRPNIPVLEQSLRALKQDVEDIVNELCRDRQAEELGAIERLVLDHSARRVMMERAWTIATGFETDPSAIPPIADLLYPADAESAQTSVW